MIYDTDVLTGETFVYDIPGGLGTWDPRTEARACELARAGEVLTLERMRELEAETQREVQREIDEARAQRPPSERWLAKADGLLAEWAISGAHPERREQMRQPIARWLEWAYEEGRAGR